MEEVQVKQKKKGSGVKVLGIILAVILCIAIIAIIFISVVTIPKKDTSDKMVPVGGLVVSDEVDYRADSDKKLTKNPVIKLMEMVWYFCSFGDESKHAKQTPPQVEMIKDIPYIDDGNMYHKLDVFYPENTLPTDKLPVVIDIHGGGWMYATKDLNEYYCRAIANKGYIVFSISYRLVPDVTVDLQLQDVADALKWIENNMSSYPCNTNSIMLTGDSAGGQLAVYSEILMQSEELRQIFNVQQVNLNVDALVLTSPVSYMDDGILSVYTKILWGSDYKNKSTANYMNLDEIIDFANDMPPTYLITSSGDTLANKQTHKAAELLESKGVTVDIEDYGKFENKKLPHVFSVLFPFDEIGNQAIDGALSFYDNAVSEKQTAEAN